MLPVHQPPTPLRLGHSVTSPGSERAYGPLPQNAVWNSSLPGSPSRVVQVVPVHVVPVHVVPVQVVPVQVVPVQVVPVQVVPVHGAAPSHESPVHRPPV